MYGSRPVSSASGGSLSGTSATNDAYERRARSLTIDEHPPITTDRGELRAHAIGEGARAWAEITISASEFSARGRAAFLKEWAQRHPRDTRWWRQKSTSLLLETVRQVRGSSRPFRVLRPARVDEAVHPRVELPERKALVTDHDREMGGARAGMPGRARYRCAWHSISRRCAEPASTPSSALGPKPLPLVRTADGAWTT